MPALDAHVERLIDLALEGDVAHGDVTSEATIEAGARGEGVFLAKQHLVLAGGAALMVLIGILVFKEPAPWPRLLGIALAILGLLLLRSSAGK